MTENYSPFRHRRRCRRKKIRQGRMVVLVDDEDRENEGGPSPWPLKRSPPDAINFMAKYGRGLICLPLTEERCDELHLRSCRPINTSVHGTAFTEAVDARVGVTTGISASDRAITILTAIDPKRSRRTSHVRGTFSAARAHWRSPRPRWSNRSLRGSRAHRWIDRRGVSSANHERRRHHVSRAAAR